MEPSSLMDGEKPVTIFAYIRKCDNNKGDLSLRLSDPGLFVYETLDQSRLEYMSNSEGEDQRWDETSPTSNEQDIDSDSDSDMSWNSDEEPYPASGISGIGPVLYGHGQWSDVGFTTEIRANGAMHHGTALPNAAAQIAASRTTYYDRTVHTNGPGWGMGTAPETRREVDAAKVERPFKVTQDWSRGKSMTIPKREKHQYAYRPSAAAFQTQARQTFSLALRSQSALYDTGPHVDTAIAEPINVRRTLGPGEHVGATVQNLERKRIMAWLKRRKGADVLLVASLDHGHDTTMDTLPNTPDSLSSEVAGTVQTAQEISSSETPSSWEEVVPIVRRNSFNSHPSDYVRNVLLHQRPHSTAPNESGGIASPQDDTKSQTSSSPSPSSSAQNLPQSLPHVPCPVHAGKPAMLPPVTSFNHVLGSIAAFRIGRVTPDDREGPTKQDDEEAETGGGGRDKAKGSGRNNNASLRTPSANAEGEGRSAGVGLGVSQTLRGRPLRHQPGSSLPTRPGDNLGSISKHLSKANTRDDTDQLRSSGRSKKRQAAVQNPSPKTAQRDEGGGRGLPIPSSGTSRRSQGTRNRQPDISTFLSKSRVSRSKIPISN